MACDAEGKGQAHLQGRGEGGQAHLLVQLCHVGRDGVGVDGGIVSIVGEALTLEQGEREPLEVARELRDETVDQ